MGFNSGFKGLNVPPQKQKYSFLEYAFLSFFQEEYKVIFQTPGVNYSKQC